MLKDLFLEIKSFVNGKSIDALLPSILFVILNQQFNLTIAIAGSLIFVLFTLIRRLLLKDNIKYSLFGLASLLFASILDILTNNPNTYFLPDLLTNLLIALASLISFILHKPIAAYASHLTRSWPLDWFWRNDIKPAYQEVSFIWFIFFGLKSMIQISNLLGSNINLGFINLLLGFPFTLFVMSISYIYGIIRLKQLKGPSVEEFILKKEAPYKGQTKGF